MIWADITKVFREVLKTWSPEGAHGWHFNRRASSVHANLQRFPVFSAGLALSSDAFDYFSPSGRTFNVNATKVGLGCLSPTLLRRLQSWQLASMGLPGAAWELGVAPLMMTIKLLLGGY